MRALPNMVVLRRGDAKTRCGGVSYKVMIQLRTFTSKRCSGSLATYDRTHSGTGVGSRKARMYWGGKAAKPESVVILLGQGAKCISAVEAYEKLKGRESGARGEHASWDLFERRLLLPRKACAVEAWTAGFSVELAATFGVGS